MKYLLILLIFCSCEKGRTLWTSTGYMKIQNKFYDPIVSISSPIGSTSIEVPKDTIAHIELYIENQEIKVTLSSGETHQYYVAENQVRPDFVLEIK